MARSGKSRDGKPPRRVNPKFPESSGRRMVGERGCPESPALGGATPRAATRPAAKPRVAATHETAARPADPSLAQNSAEATARAGADPNQSGAPTEVDAHRQGDGARRPLLAPRSRSAGSRRAASWSTARMIKSPALRCRPARPHRGRWRTAADRRTGAAVALSQTAGPRDHAQGPRRAADRVREAAARHAARDLYRPARFQYRRPAAADQRRRTGAPSGAARDRLAAPLSRARVRRRHAGSPRRPRRTASKSTACAMARSRRRSIRCRAPTSG